MEQHVNNETIKSIKLGLASPEKIRSNSFGEVKKSETINYRSHKPENDGLFCAKIFGPMKDHECLCGKIKRKTQDGKTCPECGVEITTSDVRRERMGHIELAAPVIHPWQFSVPSKMGHLLDLYRNDIRDIAYYKKYIVLESTNPNVKVGKFILKEEYQKYMRDYGSEIRIGKGAEALKEMLASIDLETEIERTREKVESKQKEIRRKANKKLELLLEFQESGNKPEWMILDVLPVIPPELRPIIQLDGGRFTSSDLNDLYRKVINRNNKVKKAIEDNYPSIMLEETVRMLQMAVNELIGVKVEGTDPSNALSSLFDKIKGKKGRFRQNLLGKRVDFSGRSVIVVGPDMEINQCGLPKKMVLELFKPMIIGQLLETGKAITIKQAKKIIDEGRSDALEIVEELVKEKVVLLNRAPTLHRLGIQAFYPKLIDGKAIRLHPLVCAAYNADFDGDQMAVHLPLSDEAQAEAKNLLLGSKNVLNPKDGVVIIGPSQDMVLGNYYLTTDSVGSKNEGRIYLNMDDVKRDLENGVVTLATRVVFKASKLSQFKFAEGDESKYLITTVGKLIFNEILPEGFNYINDAKQIATNSYVEDHWFVTPDSNLSDIISDIEKIQPFKKKDLEKILELSFDIFGTDITSNLANKIKNIGFKYSTKAGFTISAFDIKPVESKPMHLAKAEAKVEDVYEFYNDGLLSDSEKTQQIIEIWTKATDDVKAELADHFNEDNELFMMADSGARGNTSNFAQLAGMRGLMADASGRTIEIPVKSCFIEGLNVLEYFTSTNGARKGSVDTALRTADAGYLTRTLVDVAQDVVIKEHDCGTHEGLTVEAYVDGDQTIVGLYERIVGRYSAEIVPTVINKDDLITPELADKVIAYLEETGRTSFKVRSVLTCESEIGACVKCYGVDLSTGKDVVVGTAIGVVAAQSIGEPGTQLTMRTFHTGGVAGEDITSGFPRVKMLFDALEPYKEDLFKSDRIKKKGAILAKFEGEITSMTSKVINANGDQNFNFEARTADGDINVWDEVISKYHKLIVKKGTVLELGDPLTDGAFSPKELLQYKGKEATIKYIANEIQKVYRLQGVDVNDKHVETILKKMLGFVSITEPGDASIVEGAILTIRRFNQINKKLEERGAKLAKSTPVVLGVKKASIFTDSYLSAASFQEVSKVLNDASHEGKIDELIGLKENVIIGNLIPAGTGINPNFIAERTSEKFLENEES